MVTAKREAIYRGVLGPLAPNWVQGQGLEQGRAPNGVQGLCPWPPGVQGQGSLPLTPPPLLKKLNGSGRIGKVTKKFSTGAAAPIAPMWLRHCILSPQGL